jgi:hypothetical protein
VEGQKISHTHTPHPWTFQRKLGKELKQAQSGNGKVAVVLTKAVGSMWCAYIFAGWAILGLPGITILPNEIVQWVSQTFVQLVMLSVIMVGQSLLGAASDQRADQTFKDVEALLSEYPQLHTHLGKQDDSLNLLHERMTLWFSEKV